MQHPTPTVGILTLGCRVNQYESEAIAEALAAKGLALLPPTELCDVYIINTCTVTAESDRKARQAIRRLLHRNPNAYILVTGCLSQVSPEQVSAIAGVDYICGNASKLSVVDAAVELLAKGKKLQTPQLLRSAPDAHGFEAMSITKFDRTRAYIKIEDGCENHCTYCIIPSARGSVRSKAPADVLREVRQLTEGGCREVVLTGIETASYGRDLEGCDLAELLTAVDGVAGIGRVRLGSLDPSLMKQSFVDRIAPLSSLAPHFHLSMQSGSDSVLARMKRKYNTRMALEGMARLRAAFPSVQFTTDMIVGFPGESEEEFAQTLEFVQEAGFLMIHVFPYSKRAGTPAAAMSGQIPEQVKHERLQLLCELQADIRRRILDGMTGKTVHVLFETYTNGLAFGHTPEFLEVCCPAPAPLHAELLPVRILGNDGTVCRGELVSLPNE